jgi:hypothetical protein
MWGRRFRLPTCHVSPQKASPLASRSHGGELPVCRLAFGWLHPPGPAVAAPAAPESAGRAFLVLTVKWTKLLSDQWLRDVRVDLTTGDYALVDGLLARQANLIPSRTGEANPRPSCAGRAKLDRLVRYVAYNPVSASLATNPHARHWSSAPWLAGESACPTISANPREM